MKEKIQALMKRHNICSAEEMEEAILFVEELLGDYIEETKEKYPTATNSINRMEIARREVNDLRDLLDEL